MIGAFQGREREPDADTSSLRFFISISVPAPLSQPLQSEPRARRNSLMFSSMIKGFYSLYDAPSYAESVIFISTFSLFTVWIAWRFWRFSVVPQIWPNEPRLLPYLIPFIGRSSIGRPITVSPAHLLCTGHTISFLRHPDSILSRVKYVRTSSKSITLFVGV